MHKKYVQNKHKMLTYDQTRHDLSRKMSRVGL